MTKHKPPMVIMIFRIILIVTTSIDIILRPQIPLMLKVAFIFGIILLHMNDHLRNRYQFFENNRILYYISMMASIVGTGLYLIRFDSLPLNFYFVFPIVEIVLYRPWIQIGLLIFHVFVFLSVMFVLKAGVQEALLPYLAMLLLIYLFRSNSREKEKGNLLNAELMEANAKLKEITIVKERTRIAQELHDSIGHALIALKMHLEFAENMIDTDPKKSKEVLGKALGISQTSITDLRKAVDVLKDDHAWKVKIKLRNSLDDLIESLQIAGGLKFELFFDDTAEYTSKEIQKGIYETVREAITNGIKHGNARGFYIEIFVHDNKLLVKIEDDGAGCADIKKSHGLQGMEDRIHSLNGKIQFVSTKGKGFVVEAEIPFVTSVG
ncbi:sensor histidine kinase [Neobacillus vireti]|uniref:histidine kinase n=1 Tax=Neobacillus vireti LMG 21834 TaxID=1131730 RepID=A0AB94IMV5_9BACI|nr:sensor histidine kinase [Neobacillus vireti]ETI68350.1 sensory transduction protein kinase [Neobacillus vireti LMG 21834]